MNDALARRRHQTARRKPLQQGMPVPEPPLSQTIAEQREEELLGPSREVRESGIKRRRSRPA